MYDLTHFMCPKCIQELAGYHLLYGRAGERADLVDVRPDRVDRRLFAEPIDRQPAWTIQGNAQSAAPASFSIRLSHNKRERASADSQCGNYFGARL